MHSKPQSEIPASSPAVVGLIGLVELFEIVRQALVTPGQFPLELGLREVPIAVVHGLQPRTVDRQKLAAKQIQFPTQHDERSKHLSKRRTVVAPKVGDRLEIRLQLPEQPYHLKIAMGLRFQPLPRAAATPGTGSRLQYVPSAEV